ncbi:MAG: hypothetical protein MHM6MM_004882 [Cercozoa sp. M6MM]
MGNRQSRRNLAEEWLLQTAVMLAQEYYGTADSPTVSPANSRGGTPRSSFADEDDSKHDCDHEEEDTATVYSMDSLASTTCSSTHSLNDRDGSSSLVNLRRLRRLNVCTKAARSFAKKYGNLDLRGAVVMLRNRIQDPVVGAAAIYLIFVGARESGIHLQKIASSAVRDLVPLSKFGTNIEVPRSLLRAVLYFAGGAATADVLLAGVRQGTSVMNLAVERNCVKTLDVLLEYDVRRRRKARQFSSSRYRRTRRQRERRWLSAFGQAAQLQRFECMERILNCAKRCSERRELLRTAIDTVCWAQNHTEDTPSGRQSLEHTVKTMFTFLEQHFGSPLFSTHDESLRVSCVAQSLTALEVVAQYRHTETAWRYSELEDFEFFVVTARTALHALRASPWQVAGTLARVSTFLRLPFANSVQHGRMREAPTRDVASQTEQVQECTLQYWCLLQGSLLGDGDPLMLLLPLFLDAACTPGSTARLVAALLSNGARITKQTLGDGLRIAREMRTSVHFLGACAKVPAHEDDDTMDSTLVQAILASARALSRAAGRERHARLASEIGEAVPCLDPLCLATVADFMCYMPAVSHSTVPRQYEPITSIPNYPDVPVLDYFFTALSSDTERRIVVEEPTKKRRSRDIRTVMLLGAGGSGKSCLTKHLSMRFTGSSPQKPKENAFCGMRDIVRTAATKLVQKSIDFDNVGLENPRSYRAALTLTSRTEAMQLAGGYANVDDLHNRLEEATTPAPLEEDEGGLARRDAQDILALWEEPSIQRTWQRLRTEAEDHIPYVLPRALQFVTDQRRITPLQWSMAHFRTTGVLPTDFNITQVRHRNKQQHVYMQGVRVMDPGGQRCERRKWTLAASQADAFVVCVSASDFRQIMFEDSGNRLVEVEGQSEVVKRLLRGVRVCIQSVAVLRSVMNDIAFADRPFFLTVTKCDLLQQLVQFENVPFSYHGELTDPSLTELMGLSPLPADGNSTNSTSNSERSGDRNDVRAVLLALLQLLLHELPTERLRGVFLVSCTDGAALEDMLAEVLLRSFGSRSESTAVHYYYSDWRHR